MSDDPHPPHLSRIPTSRRRGFRTILFRYLALSLSWQDVSTMHKRARFGDCRQGESNIAGTLLRKVSVLDKS
jgi:hypothetical protein